MFLIKIKNRKKTKKGISSLEFAFLLPILVSVLLGSVMIFELQNSRSVLAQAAHLTVRECGIRGDSFSCIQTVFSDTMPGSICSSTSLEFFTSPSLTVMDEVKFNCEVQTVLNPSTVSLKLPFVQKLKHPNLSSIRH